MIVYLIFLGIWLTKTKKMTIMKMKVRNELPINN